MTETKTEVRENNVMKRVVTFRCNNPVCFQDWLAWNEQDDICGTCGSYGHVTGNKIIAIQKRPR